MLLLQFHGKYIPKVKLPLSFRKFLSFSRLFEKLHQKFSLESPYKISYWWTTLQMYVMYLEFFKSWRANKTYEKTYWRQTFQMPILYKMFCEGWPFGCTCKKTFIDLTEKNLNTCQWTVYLFLTFSTSMQYEIGKCKYIDY